jgi:transposase-like protein
MSIEHELAGFVDQNGGLGRPVPSGQIIVPRKVWRQGDTIRWRMGPWPPHTREVSRSMLNQFVQLADAESVLRFARGWGVLALSRDEDRRPGGEDGNEGVEPIAAWLAYARRARAVLNIAAALKLNNPGDLNDWGEFGIFVVSGSYTQTHEDFVKAFIDRPDIALGVTLFAMGESPAGNIQAAREAIGTEIGHWLDGWKQERNRGVSDFALRWDDVHQRWDLQIDYHGLLFAAIALQLALVVANADSLYSCSGCGLPYIRSRERKRPKRGWANYCESCSKEGTAQRRAVENYREKKAQAVQLHLGGIPAKRIAEQLNTSAACVNGWLKKVDDHVQAKTRKQ